MAKTVCIVGAGPAGLTAAKNLLHGAPKDFFKVTLFDAQKDIGGLWPTSVDDTQRQIHPLMFTNGSKHTVAFSDLCWDDDSIDQFPRAHNVGEYLHRYLKRHLQGNKSFQLVLDTRVVNAERPEGDSGPWSVKLESSSGSQTQCYDYLIVASGFFGKPIIPPYFRDDIVGRDIPVVHSCHYRNLKSLLGKGRPGGGKILVVGGQMSGVEISGTIATHLSSAIHSPDDCGITDIEHYSIHNVVPRPTWVFPLFTSPEPASSAPPFLPLEFSLLNRSNRGEVLVNTQGHIDEENAEFLHGLYQYMLGGSQSEFSSEMEITDDFMTTQPHMSVSDWYSEFVRSGMIEVTLGKVVSMKGRTAHISGDADDISNVAAVVIATGFDPTPCLEFLPEDVRRKMSHSPEHVNQPLALAFHGTHHPAVPHIGFVGFYRNPYWGVMEMQARFLTKLWSDPDSASLQRMLADDDSIERTLSLRDDPRVSQYPMGDYPWLMQEFAQALQLEMSPLPQAVAPPVLSHNDRPLDTLTPARYLDASPEEQARREAAVSIHNVATAIEAALTTPKYVARGVFRSLLGRWNVETTVFGSSTSAAATASTTTTLSSTADFNLRRKTADGVQHLTNGHRIQCDDEGFEYVCVEAADPGAEASPAIAIHAPAIWRYDESNDSLSIWSAQQTIRPEADAFSHTLSFQQPEDESEREEGWRATAAHLRSDEQTISYKFKFEAVNLQEWSITTHQQDGESEVVVAKVFTR